MKTRSLLRFGGVSLLAAVPVVGLATPAQASSAFCRHTFTCSTSEFNFSGGRASFDFDGYGNAGYRLSLTVNGVERCYVPIVGGAEPPRSWTCTNLPAGTLTLTSSTYDQPADHKLGLRPHQ